MNNLNKILNNCKQATFLIEKKSIRRLTFRETIELRIHLYGCSFCKLYGKQSRAINHMVRQLFHSTTQSNIRLDDHFKRDLQERIETELNKN
ncbi:MAG TPA: hypothetical protein VNW95_18055 [Mucilaginibacter sp.]|jgi:hypothetical protein|nr:hypothetical protein [Mucilaginibacter sp.]